MIDAVIFCAWALLWVGGIAAAHIAGTRSGERPRPRLTSSIFTH